MTVKEWLGEDNQLGQDIYERKYRYNNESFEEWLDRVSGGDLEVKDLIRQKKFLFGGRILANRGTDKTASLSNCYSRGFCEDSLDDLMQAAVDIAHTFKAQGGQGLSLSKVRPKGTGINGGQFKSDGIIPFMEIYNRVTESISQGGSRKGALLMSLDIWHKEAEEFIKIKSEEGRIQKANLSLEIDDEFMSDVLKFYKTGEVVTKTIKREYNGNKIEYEVTPIKLYKLMMQKAYDWGEPGCIFVNRFRNYNLMEYVNEYSIETCNPCGEQPLPKHSACNLGSINLSEFVEDPFTKKAHFNIDEFVKAVRICIRALDKIIDENYKNHALIEQQTMALRYRNCGLGIMGLYDCLAKLNIRYDDGNAFIDSLMDVMFRSAVIESNELAKADGAFPGWSDQVILSKILRNHFDSVADRKILDDIEKYGLRNCSLLSIAPSGSIATMLNVSTGCEPLFAISYQRKTESLNDGEDKYYTVYAGIVNEYFKVTGNKEIPSFFVESHDVPWKKRIDLQAILQNHVDTAISSTVNLKNDVSLKEVERLYLYAWEKGLKGVTIFRDGCARTGILTTDKESKSDTSSENISTMDTLPRGYIVKADDNCVGKKRTLQTGCGTLHVEAFFDPDDGRLLETYFSRGSSGGCSNSYTGLSRMISLAARGGVDIYSIVDQLKSSNTCPSYAVRSATKHDTSKGSSCPVAIGNALMDMYKEMQYDIGESDDDPRPVKVSANVYPKKETIVVDGDNKCPICGDILIFSGGCRTCQSCGWSKCD